MSQKANDETTDSIHKCQCLVGGLSKKLLLREKAEILREVGRVNTRMEFLSNTKLDASSDGIRKLRYKSEKRIGESECSIPFFSPVLARH